MHSPRKLLPGHIDLHLLNEKIKALFEYRMFPFLMEMVDYDADKKDVFYEHLFDLQTSIYLLDAHLEGQWNVQDEVRKNQWADIVRCLKKCISTDRLPGPLLKHIEKYEKHELSLRDGKWPTRFAMTYFYFYKSCDVKLLRRLIYDFGNLEKKTGSLSRWRLFDFVTEVNDDITDVYEDVTFYNGNRFLIQILLKGKKETLGTFGDFLHAIRSELDKKLSDEKLSTMDAMIFSESKIQCDLTIDLLMETVDSIDLHQLRKDCVIFPYLSGKHNENL